MTGAIHKDNSGAAAIEFALVFPVLIVFLLGIIDVGRLLWTQTALDRSVLAAARCAAVDTTTCGTTTGIKNYASSEAYGVTINSSAYTVTSGSTEVCVSVAMTFRLIIPWVGNTVNLSANSCYPVS